MKNIILGVDWVGSVVASAILAELFEPVANEAIGSGAYLVFCFFLGGGISLFFLYRLSRDA